MKNLFIIILTFLAYSALGKSIPQSTAEIVAKNYFQFVSGLSEREIHDCTIKNIEFNGQETVSILNFDKGGWIMVSRESAMMPVLAYSKEGSFQYNENSGLNSLQEVSVQYWNHFISNKKVRNINDPTEHSNWKLYQRKENLYARNHITPVEPLLGNSSNWGYGYPYYAGLPEYLSTDNTCVPNSIAQLVKYWEYPSKPKGSVTYRTSSNPLIDLTMDFESIEPLNFELMPYAMSDPYHPYTPYYTQSDPEAIEIGRLQYYCWFMAHMRNTQGSFVNTSTGNRLVNHFGFDPNFEYITVLQTDPVWKKDQFKSKLRNDLDNGYPVLMNWNGHMFITDGYQDDGSGNGNFNYFHTVQGHGTAGEWYYFFTEDENENYYFPIGFRSELYQAFFNLKPSFDPCFIAPGQADYVISQGQNVVWSKMKSGIENIVVETGGELTIESIASFAQNGKIIVKRGARLNVNGGTLTTCGNDKWEGIFIHGNQLLDHPQDPLGVLDPNETGVVIFNDAIIENANNAITCDNHYLSNWQEKSQLFGGLVIANNSTFRNSFRGVEFMQYTRKNKSSFDNCTFKGLKLGVTVWNNSDIIIKNCIFEDIEREAVGGIDAGLKIESGNSFNRCDIGVKNIASSPGMAKLSIGDITKTANEFKNLRYGLYMAQSSNGYSESILENNLFEDNYHHILMYGENEFSIQYNEFLMLNGSPLNDRMSIYGRATGINPINSVKCNFFDGRVGLFDILMSYNNEGFTFLQNDFTQTNPRNINFLLFGHQNDVAFPGKVHVIQGYYWGTAENCFTSYKQNSLRTTQNTDFFSYFYGTEENTCEKPGTTGGNYYVRKGWENGNFCDYTIGNPAVLSDIEAKKLIKDYCDFIRIVPGDENGLAQLSKFKQEYSRNMGRYLNYLEENQMDTKIIETLKDMCDCPAKKKLFSFYLQRRRFAEAQSVLNLDLCLETRSDTVFKKIQEINLKWYSNDSERYYPTAVEQDFLRNTALSALPESASAQTVLFLTTGEWLEAPIEIPDLAQIRTSFDNPVEKSSFSIFPNPSKEKIVLSINDIGESLFKLYLYDLSGKIMVEKQLTKEHNEIDVRTLPEGVYVLIVRDVFGFASFYEKVVINR